MTGRTYTIVFVDRKPEVNEQVRLSVESQGMEFWKADGFWEFRFLHPRPDADGTTTFLLKILERDLIQVVGHNL